jgi:hypothetical protein
MERLPYGLRLLGSWIDPGEKSGYAQAGQGRAGTETDVSMRPRFSVGLCIALSTFFAACSESRLATPSMDTASSVSEDASDTAQDDMESSDTAVIVAPMWWRLSASLVLVQGTPVPEKSSLTVELLGSKDESLCTQQRPLLVTEEWADAYDSVLAAWKLSPEPVELLCGLYEPPLDESIVLGIGEMHPDIQAAIGSIPELDGDAPLNAAYMVSIDKPDDLYVYGVAGTSTAYAGEGKVVSELPLEDESWQLEPVYRFSY